MSNKPDNSEHMHTHDPSRNRINRTFLTARFDVKTIGSDEPEAHRARKFESDSTASAVGSVFLI